MEARARARYVAVPVHPVRPGPPVRDLRRRRLAHRRRQHVAAGSRPAARRPPGPAGDADVRCGDRGRRSPGSTWCSTTAPSPTFPRTRRSTSGRFQPTDDDAPAPAARTTIPTRVRRRDVASLSVFDGTDPNGAWSLYAVDDEAGDFSEILGGWSLHIETDEPAYRTHRSRPRPAAPERADLAESRRSSRHTAAVLDTTSPTPVKIKPGRKATGVRATSKVRVSGQRAARAGVGHQADGAAHQGLDEGQGRGHAPERGATIVLTPRKAADRQGPTRSSCP